MATKKTTNTKRRSTSRKKGSYKRTKQDYELKQDIKIIVVIAVAVFLFVCNFGLIGAFGNAISNVLFGVFGILNYIVALFIAFLIVFSELYGSNGYAIRKVCAFSVLFLLVDMVIELIGGIAPSLSKFNIKELFMFAYSDHKGGGIIASSITYGLLKAIDKAGTIILIIVLVLICIIILTEKSLLKAVKETSVYMRERSIEDRQLRKELSDERAKEQEERRELRHKRALEMEEQRRLQKEQAQEDAAKRRSDIDKRELAKQAKDDRTVLRKNKKAVGVTFNTDLGVQPQKEEDLVSNTNENDDIHEIVLNGFDPGSLKLKKNQVETPATEFEPVINMFDDSDDYIPGTEAEEEIKPVSPSIVKPVSKPKEIKAEEPSVDTIRNAISENGNKEHSEYEFPPRTLLNKGIKKAGDSAASIKQTAQKLQETLAIFGVEATVTDISQGPTVTRFELQPKLGVKVSRIKSLSDDIKLNLAASEIRIEAPIPGKAAIGIEVPNKETQPVLFRDLIDTKEYDDFNSNLAFAVGKDISGKTIVYGIENFPHLLIAGATGSGKSVCINTLIMSIIYKANPDDVKLIMIDPKVVELSVYNGIPHLMLPVVTDVKKASATLNFAVNEMQERYKKFAEYGARDLAGYNRIVMDKGEDVFNRKMPHIVIIVDEVADLMLQERKNVEDSICSLAQLARAAGIHLIIATQRPSVDVITGLIKANMPSRIAFAVSSNVDSRTILDMGGAEELLGKGDMLFFPKGLKKPVRLQGGFISDKEVNDVVDFLRKQGTVEYDASIDEKIKSFEKKSDSGSMSSGSDDMAGGNDEFFVEAGFYIIDSNKASIGMLQRKFKMGFNRAARIMDQLADAGVVGPDLGTKPREILMSHESFENYLEEYGG